LNRLAADLAVYRATGRAHPHYFTRRQGRFVPNREQQHFSLGMGVEHHMARQHQFPELGQAQCAGKLLRLLGLKLPPA